MMFDGFVVPFEALVVSTVVFELMFVGLALEIAGFEEGFSYFYHCSS